MLYKKIENDVYIDLLLIADPKKVRDVIDGFVTAIDKLKDNKKYLKDEDQFIISYFVFLLNKYNKKHCTEDF